MLVSVECVLIDFVTDVTGGLRLGNVDISEVFQSVAFKTERMATCKAGILVPIGCANLGNAICQETKENRTGNY